MASGEYERAPLASMRTGRTPRFLLVDEDPLVLKVMHRTLQAQRPTWQLSDAHSTRAALIDLCTREYDVVVTELELPDNSGLDLIATLDHYYPHVACVVYSSRLEKYLGHPALSSVAILLGKHAEPGRLVAALNEALWASVVARRDDSPTVTRQYRKAYG
jgi:DNA-binding NarL/FixJ family response regulator